jgi:hypothetical protein
MTMSEWTKPRLYEEWRDGQRIASTDFAECIPTPEQSKQRQAAGYKVKLGGRGYTLDAHKALLKGSK